jgi:hypothetical protein
VHPNKEASSNVFKGVVELYKGREKPREQSTASTKTGEIKLLKDVAQDISFTTGSAAVPNASKPKLQELATYLKRISVPQFTVHIQGHASNADPSDLSAQRAQAVKDELEGYGRGSHSLVASGKGKTGAAKVEFDPKIADEWKNYYPVIVHEFGHMIGLDDEYNYGPAKADHYELVKEAFGEAYADRVATLSDDDKAAIMDGGKDVRIYHYVTFWDALCKTTTNKANVPASKFGRDDWKFIE